MNENLFQNKIAAAIRTERDFSKALKSKVDVVFLLHANIMTVKKTVNEIKSAGKKSFVHIDFAEGIGRDRAGMEFIAKCGVDGVLTTRTSIVKIAKDLGLIAVQRFFLVDSRSLSTSIDGIRASSPDIVELMPGIITKKISEISKSIDIPIIAGGIVETEEEVKEAIDAGASLVSTGEPSLWNIDI